MIDLIKLKSKDMFLLNQLEDEYSSINEFREGVIDNYNECNFIKKFFFRKKIYLIKNNEDVLGYVWFENFNSDTIKIIDMFLKTSVEDFKLNTIKEFKGKNIIYESLEIGNITKVLYKNSFEKFKTSKLLKKYIKEYIGATYDYTGLNFSTFVQNKDESDRCRIQNSIFSKKDRIPLSKYDIEFEQSQSYYINEFCIFLKKDDIKIGYGQIIYYNNVYTIVNLGIIKEYRGMGYGEILLNHLIYLAKASNIDQLYIRVDPTNYKAENLYTKLGFEYIGYYSTWILC